MLFAFHCKDRPGALELRLATRPAHLQYLGKLADAGVVQFAGPFLDETGKPNGTLMVVDAPDRQSAEQIGRDDPYAKAGLFESVEIRAWNWVFNRPGFANP